MAAATAFGKYLLHERIALGGMAELFRASLRDDAGFAMPIAIKRVLPELASDETFIRMLVDEAKIASQLSHPNIAQVLDLGTVDGQYYIAQEYVDGRDLGDVRAREAKRERRIPGPLTVHVLMKVCEALDHAHNAHAPGRGHLGIIHRDVSPQNILLSHEGEVKVVDFGLAKATVQHVRTKTGMIKGKLAYLSPEQAHGEEIDHRSDLYALGICAWEMLTGERLYARQTDADTVLAVRRGEVPPLGEYAPQAPAALRAIVERALARDREARFATAMQMHEALETYQYGHGEHVRPQQVARYLNELFPEDRPLELSGTDTDATAPHTVPLEDADGFGEDEGTTEEVTRRSGPLAGDTTEVTAAPRGEDDPTREVTLPDEEQD